MKLIFFALTGLASAAAVFAQSTPGTVSGPLLGLMKKSAVLRPLIGVPGAAYFGPAMDLAGLETAAVSPARGYAVVLTQERTSASVITLDSGGAAIPANTDRAIDMVRLSPSGTAAALLRGMEVDLIAGLPHAPALKRTVLLAQIPVALAVADDAGALAVFAAGVVSLVHPDGEKTLASSDAISGMHFLPQTHDFVYGDGASVMRASAAGATQVAGPADELGVVRLLLPARSGEVLFIGHDSPELTIVRLEGGGARRVPLPCVAAELDALADSTVAVRCEQQDRIHLVQSGTGVPRVLFVPEPVE